MLRLLTATPIESELATMERPRSKRRWTQFTLRAALLVVLVIAASLAARTYFAAPSGQFDTHRELFDEYRSRGEPSPYDGLPIDAR